MRPSSFSGGATTSSGAMLDRDPAGRRIRQAITPIERPDHFSVRDDGSTIRIRYWWAWSRFTRPAMICLVWNGFLVGWYWNAIRDGSRIAWLAMVFTLPHALIGLGVFYYTVAGLLNRTLIRLTSESIVVRHGPVPWWSGNRQLPTDNIERVCCDKDREQADRGWRYIYRVNALTRDGTKFQLIDDLDRQQAFFIKQELERWLKLGTLAHHRIEHPALSSSQVSP